MSYIQAKLKLQNWQKSAYVELVLLWWAIWFQAGESSIL
jgi:hypothetical protein